MAKIIAAIRIADPGMCISSTPKLQPTPESHGAEKLPRRLNVQAHG